MTGWTESVNVFKYDERSWVNSLRRMVCCMVTWIGVTDIQRSMVERLPTKKLIAIYNKLYNASVHSCPMLAEPSLYALCYVTDVYRDEGENVPIISELQVGSGLDIKEVLTKSRTFMVKYEENWSGMMPVSLEIGRAHV